jgi:hypothetical protein
MFHNFLLPRGPRSTPEAPAGRLVQVNKPTQDPAPRLTVRLAEPSDHETISRLAALDSARMPHGVLLVGEISGSIQAAVSLAGGRPIANPFVRTAELLTLLELRAEQLREQGVAPAEPARVIPLPRRHPKLAPIA